MRQFDLFDNPAKPMRSVAPYVVMLSSHLFLNVLEAVVAPVVLPGHLEPSEFDVPVKFGDQDFIVSIIGLAAIRRDRLSKPVGSIDSSEYDVRRALDRLFTGF